jgi:hypothetical protein
MKNLLRRFMKAVDRALWRGITAIIRHAVLHNIYITDVAREAMLEHLDDTTLMENQYEETT